MSAQKRRPNRSAPGPDEPLLEYGITLAQVVAAVEAGQAAENSPAFIQAAYGGRRAGELLAWVADAEPALALPSVALVVMQLAQIRELIRRREGEAGGRLAELYNPDLELVLATRDVQLRVGLALQRTRDQLGLSMADFARRLGIQPGRMALLEAGRLDLDRNLARAIDAIVAGDGAAYLEAVGGSASAAVLRIGALQSQIERLQSQ